MQKEGGGREEEIYILYIGAELSLQFTGKSFNYNDINFST